MILLNKSNMLIQLLKGFMEMNLMNCFIEKGKLEANCKKRCYL